MSSSPRTFLDSLERWLLRAILIAVLVLALLLSFALWQARHQGTGGGRARTGVAPNLAAPASSAITLTIDFGDGTQRRFTDLPFSPGMTVLDLMKGARQHAPLAHALPFDSVGSGVNTLITEIDGVHNEGAGTNPSTARNWQFWVNGVYSELSVGQSELHAADKVSWAFRPYGKDRTPPP